MEDLDARTAPRPGSRLRWILGCGLVLAGMGGLAVWAAAAPDAASYYVTPSEVVAEAPSPERMLRLGGEVAGGTLEREGSFVAFAVTDGSHRVPVTYTGEVPDTLQEGTDVVAEGTLDPSGTLVATRVLAKCSSKFVPEEAAAPASG